jgi:hypothetical protein
MLGALVHAEARNEAVALVEDLRPWNRGRGKGSASAALTAVSRGSEKRKSF